MSDIDEPTPPPGIRVLGQPSSPRSEAGEASSSETGLATTGASTSTEDAVEDAAEGKDLASVPGAGRQARPGVLLALVMVAILGVAGTITFGLLWAHDQSQQSGAKSVEAGSRSAAQQFLTDFTTFSPSTVNRTFADIQAMSTGNFANQAKAEFSASLRQQLQAANASTQGQVRYLELQAYTSSAATYYADVVQTYSNNKTSGPQSDELRLVVSLSLVHGQWKVAAVTSLDTPAVPSG